MKALKTGLAALAFCLMSSFAFAGGAEAKAYQTKDDLKAGILDNIINLNVSALKIKDATVEITFKVDAEGKLELTSVESESEFLEAFIRQMLKDVSMDVASHLSNKSYKLKVRYVNV